MISRNRKRKFGELIVGHCQSGGCPSGIIGNVELGVLDLVDGGLWVVVALSVVFLVILCLEIASISGCIRVENYMASFFVLFMQQTNALSI